MYGVQTQVSNTSTPPSKSVTGNGRFSQSVQERQEIFRGSLGSSLTSSDELSPISSPRGKKKIIIIHRPRSVDSLEVNLLFRIFIYIYIYTLQLRMSMLHVWRSGEEKHNFLSLCRRFSCNMSSRQKLCTTPTTMRPPDTPPFSLSVPVERHVGVCTVQSNSLSESVNWYRSLSAEPHLCPRLL